MVPVLLQADHAAGPCPPLRVLGQGAEVHMQPAAKGRSQLPPVLELHADLVNVTPGLPVGRVALTAYTYWASPALSAS